RRGQAPPPRGPPRTVAGARTGPDETARAPTAPRAGTRGRPASDWCARRRCSAPVSRGVRCRSWALVRAGARWSGALLLRGVKSLARGRLVALLDFVAPDAHEVEE